MDALAIFLRFLRFGLLAWGGPVAQIAMIRRELVEAEQWVTPQRFDRLLAIYQALPGPEAHELCVHLGMVRGGRWGGLAAGMGFLLPGLVLVVALAAAYRAFGLAPALAAPLLGMQIAVVALVAVAAWRIGRHALGDPALAAIALAALVATLAGAPFWLVLAAAGAVRALDRLGRRALAALVVAGTVAVAALLPAGPAAASAAAAAAPTLGLLFLAGLKAGLLTFGGAYTAIPFVRGDMVGRGWLSDGQFLDSLALSGLLPAPLITFASFAGVLVLGVAGGLAVTLGMFLPAFGFALLFFDRLEAVLDNARLHALLEGVAAGVVGLIAATALGLARATVGWRVETLALFAAVLALLLAWRSRWTMLALIPAAALYGWAILG